MTTYYVDSNSPGGDPGDGIAWATAWTSISSATGLVAGDTLMIEYRHTQSAGSITLDFIATEVTTNPVLVISVDKDDSNAYRTGASITQTSGHLTIQNGGSYWGISFTATGANTRVYYNTGFSSLNEYRDCTFTHGGESISLTSGTNRSHRFTNCVFNNIKNGFYCQYDSIDAVFVGCTFNETAATGGIAWVSLGSLTSGCRIAFINCTIVESAGAYTQHVDIDGDHNLVVFQDCNFPMTTSYFNPDSAYDSRLIVERTKEGTITEPGLGLDYYASLFGDITSVSVNWRTNGASNGTSSYSWKFVSSSLAKENTLYLECPPIVRGVQAGSQTLTIYVASDATLNNDDFWIEVSSPDEGGTPTAQGTVNTTKALPLATPTALTADAVSAWTGGAEVGTKQKVSVPINPAVAGPVSVRCFLAKPSTTVYVDPKIEVS